MSVFDDVINTVKSIEKSINPTIKDTFKQYDDIIKKWQTEEQLEKGEDSEGSMIRPAYRPYTIKVKRFKGQPTDRVTLKDKGKFYKSIKVSPRSKQVEITASTEYSDELFKKYGENILGIKQELLVRFINSYIIPNLRHEFKSKLTKS